MMRLLAEPCTRQAPGISLHVNRGTRFGVSTLGAVALPANDTQADGAPLPTPQIKWINVANEGDYAGHHQGEFSLTPEVMQQLIDNLRASPRYQVGPVELTAKDGTKSTAQAGTANVVQFDYEHASEMAPWEGSIPTSGAPAIGWVRDLQTRPGAAGKLELWALAWLGDQIRGQIDRQEYAWVSIAWNPEGVHWITGKPVGAVLTSIAFTNHPFMQDLQNIAAAARVFPGARAPASSASGAAGQPRNGSVERDSTSPSAGGTRGLSSPIPSREPRERDPMPEDVLRTRLCSIWRLQPQADDASIIRAADTAAASGGQLSSVLAALGVTDVDAALQGIPALVAARGQLQDMLSQLDSLMQADSTADQTVAQTDVANALTARGYAQRGMVDALILSAVLAAREAAVQAEIGKLPSTEVVLNGVKTIRPPKAGDVRAARERGRQAFLASYGVNHNPATQHLTQTFVAGPGSAGPHSQYVPLPGFGGNPPPTQLSALPGAPPLQFPQPMQLPRGGPQHDAQAIDWSALGGRNLTEKVVSYLASKDPSIEKLDAGARIRRASEWKRANPHLLPQAA